MGFVRGILKTAAGFVGMAIILGGVAAFFIGIYQLLKGRIWPGAALVAAAVLICTAATYMGKFAKGDCD